MDVAGPGSPSFSDSGGGGGSSGRKLSFQNLMSKVVEGSKYSSLTTLEDEDDEEQEEQGERV